MPPILKQIQLKTWRSSEPYFESFLTCVTQSPSTTVSIIAKQKEAIDMAAVSRLALEIAVKVRKVKVQI
jgi:hypothetical protein